MINRVVLVALVCLSFDISGQVILDSVPLLEVPPLIQGTDIFKSQYIYHTTWGVLESSIAGLALGWIVWDTHCAGRTKVVHAYVGFLVLVLGFRGVWDIHMGHQSLLHFQHFGAFYPAGRRATDRDGYDLIIQ